MITYTANELIASSELSKKFGNYLSQVREQTVDKLAVLRNNRIEAVLISKESYEHMVSALQAYEARQLLESVQAGVQDVKQGRTRPVDSLWYALDD